MSGRSGSEGGLPIYQGSWPYFNVLSFLKDQVTGRRTTGSSTSMLDTEFESDTIDVTDEGPSLMHPVEEEAQQTPVGLPRKRKSIEDDIHQKMLALEEKKLKLLEDEASHKDDVSLFLLSLAPAIRAMDPRTQSLTKLKIMEVIHSTQYPDPQFPMYDSNPPGPPSYGGNFFTS